MSINERICPYAVTYDLFLTQPAFIFQTPAAPAAPAAPAPATPHVFNIYIPASPHAPAVVQPPQPNIHVNVIVPEHGKAPAPAKVKESRNHYFKFFEKIFQFLGNRSARIPNN